MNINLQKEKMNDSILPYCQYNIPLLELHGIVDGKCTCGKNCRRAGKHPRTMHGVKDAKQYTNTAQLLFGENSNIGAACGREFLRGKYMYVFDVDPRNGGDGTLQNLEMAFGKLPATWCVQTGGGGHHFYFYSERIYSSKKAFPGIEIQGLGSYVVCPGSMHESGHEYLWFCHPDDYDLAPLPTWIADVLNPTNTVTPETTTTVPVGTVTKESGTTVPVRISKLEYDAVVAELTNIWPGDYETLIRVGMALKATGWDIHAYQKWKEWAAQNKEKYNDEQMWSKWLSFKGSGITQNTIKKLASENINYEPICIKNEPLGEAATGKPDAVECLQNTPNLLQMSSGIVRELADIFLSNAYREYPNWALASALSVLATVFQQYKLTPIGHPVSLYQIVPGEPSQGKEHYITPAKDLIEEIDPRLNMAISSSSAGLIGELYSFNSKFEAIDEFQDALGKIVKSDNPHMKEKLTNYKLLYNNPKYISVGATKQQGSVKVNDPKLTILCFGTPDAIAKMMNQENIGGGLISRFMQWPEEKPPLGIEGKLKVNVPLHIINYLRQILNKSLASTENKDSYIEREKNFRAQTVPQHRSAFGKPECIAVSNDASVILKEFHDFCNNYYCANYKLPDAASVDRSYALSLRIATIHALGRRSDTLDTVDANFGIATGKLCCGEVSRSIATAARSTLQIDCDDVIDFLKSCSNATSSQREIMRAINRFRDADRWLKIKNTLVASETISCSPGARKDQIIIRYLG